MQKITYHQLGNLVNEAILIICPFLFLDCFIPSFSHVTITQCVMYLFSYQGVIINDFILGFFDPQHKEGVNS